MYSVFYRKIIFPFFQFIFRRPTLRLHREYRRSEKLSGEAIRASQLQALNKLYQHARKCIPFYKEYYASIAMEEITSFEEFSRLPILDRGDVVKHYRQMVNETLSTTEVVLARTGGSSGEPLTFYAAPFAAPLGLALMLRAREWWGIDFNDRNAIFIEHGLKFEEDWKSRAAMALHHVRERILNRVFFSAYRMADKDLHSYYETLQHFKPVYFIGYASFLFLFAQYLEKQKLPIRSLGVRCIFYTSEMLYPWQREVIGRVFQCPVVGEYGLKEVGVVAYECPSGRIHTMDESVYVEVVPLEANPGIGDIIVTQLQMPESPFIRYRTGDQAKIVDMSEACPCGRGLHLMGSILGRSHDWIVTPSGKTIHGQIFTHALIVRGSVDKFRVHQKSDYSILIEAVTNELYTPENEKMILETLNEIIGEPLPVKIQKVKHIPAGNSGKHRWIKSDIGAFARDTHPSENPSE